MFSVDPGTGVETVLYSFCSKSECTDGRFPYFGKLLKANGLLYGTTPFGGDVSCGCGTVFSIDPATGAETVLYSFGGQTGDGQFPYAGLIDVNGTLYGTTAYGGELGLGTVFAITP